MHDDAVLKGFIRDVSAHTMTIIRDDGFYRHLSFGRPGSSTYRFDLVTWPGYLCMTGDMGTWTFSRITDMFDFFGGAFERGINPSYWSEKMEAGSGCPRDAIAKEWDEQAYCQRLDYFLKEWAEEHAPGGGAPKDLKKKYQHKRERAEGIIQQMKEGSYSEMDAYAAYASVDDPDGVLADFWEYTFKAWSTHFLWACYAIQWGISRYKNNKIALSAMDKFLAIGSAAGAEYGEAYPVLKQQALSRLQRGELKTYRNGLSIGFASDHSGVCEVWGRDARDYEGKVIARRLVACWNACKGLPTGELESVGLTGALGNELLKLDRLEDLRRDLIELRDCFKQARLPMGSAESAIPEAESVPGPLLQPGLYAIHYLDNSIGDQDRYHRLATLDADGKWVDEDGRELLQYQGDKILSAWPLFESSDQMNMKELVAEATSMRDSFISYLMSENLSKKPDADQDSLYSHCSKWVNAMCHTPLLLRIFEAAKSVEANP
ncbi:hypothetical protein [Enterobacter hormaechei]|uniref:hypothetical protein n=2 Tax=Enterobacter hormaechei TaxID=158836 RepID=UPI0007B33DA7|nr:hypothetical protein A3N47_09830 [Enterobacter hormaechei subsp. xiangfangensis]